MEYDGAWSLSLPSQNGAQRAVDEEWPAPMLGNGKTIVFPRLGLKPEMVTVDRTMACTPTFVDEYYKNLDDPFGIRTLVGGSTTDKLPYGKLRDVINFGTFKLFSRGQDVSYALSDAKLCMDTGTFTTKHDVYVEGDSQRWGSIKRDTYPVRQFPDAVMQSLAVRGRGDLTTVNVDEPPMLYHEMTPPIVAALNANTPYSPKDFKFATNIVHSELPSRKSEAKKTKTVLLFSGMGPDQAASSSYTWDPQYEGSFDIRGSNIQRTHPVDIAFNRIDLVGEGSPTGEFLGSGVEYREFRISVLTVVKTADDFSQVKSSSPQSIEESSRSLLLSILGRGFSSRPGNGDGKPHVYVRTEHTKQWNDVWKSNVNVNPKAGITDAEHERIIQLRRHLRFAQFTLFCSSRVGSSIPLNPMAVSIADVGAKKTSAQQGELWLIPCLMALKPLAVRGIIDARHAELPLASQVAHSYGYRGAKYAYENDDELHSLAAGPPYPATPRSRQRS